MARSTTVAYRLPCAVLVVTGTLRRTLDEDDPAHRDGFAGVAPTLVSKTVTLRHQADETARRTVVVKGGLFFQYKASFSSEEDGRLSKAAAEATGAGAELISAGATLAGAALGALTVFAADTDLEDRRKSNYKLAHADVMEESQALSARRTQVRACIRTLEESLVSDPASAHSLHPQLEALRAVADGIESRLTTLGAHYAAWLATRQKTVDEIFEVEVPLAELPQTLESAELRYGGPASSITERLERPLDLKAMWLRFGLGVLATWERRPAAAAPWKPGRTLPAQCLVVREAEPLRLVVVEHEHGRPAVTGRSRHLVADATSPHHELELRRSLFGRRSLTVSFSDNGYLAGIDVEGAASVGEAAKALSGVPGGVVSGLDSVNKLNSGLASARQAGVTAELARVKANVELRQQELVAAGLDATEGDAARLTRLTQLKGILEAQAAIQAIDPTFVATTQSSAVAALMLTDGAGSAGEG